MHVDVVDGVSLEFRARSRDAAEASDVANAYAEAYVELRRNQLSDDPVRNSPPTTVGPSVVIRATPARSPLPPWPSETWAAAGMVLLALALTVPNRGSSE